MSNSEIKSKVTCPRIFTDEPEGKNLALEFNNYAKTISDIILESEPQFTIGIFGEWGSGKTTLLNKIEAILHLENCTTLQFNAWRYEQETEHAKIPLMIDIIKILSDDLEEQLRANKKFQTNKQKIKDKVSKAKEFLSSWKVKEVSITLPGLLNVIANLEESNKKKSTMLETTKPQMQEGFELIRDLLQINRGSRNRELKLVVLIDDLDRCSPDKVLQIFESIKIFFNVKGIVFILGLSEKIVEMAIKEKYKHFGTKFSEKEYLEKIIQLPFSIPLWEPKNIKEYVRMLIRQHPDNVYQEIFSENIELITNVTEQNPREVKRYLNNFILSKYMNRDNLELDDKKMLIFSAMYMRWKWFLDAFFSDLNILGIKHLITNIGKQDYHKFAKGSIEDRIMKDISFTQFLKNEGRTILYMKKEEIQLYKKTSSKFLSTLRMRMMADF